MTETSGANAAHRVIGELLRSWGTAAIVGGGSPEFVVPLRHFGGGEISIFGSSAYAPNQFPEIATFVKRHNIALDAIVSETFTLDDGPEAFRVAADANTGKVVFRFD